MLIVRQKKFRIGNCSLKGPSLCECSYPGADPGVAVQKTMKHLGGVNE